MGDDNKNGSDGGGEEVTGVSVSRYFDDTHKSYIGLVRGEEDTMSESVQERIKKTIKSLEDLTRQVSVLGIFSDNENWKEMNPSELKFILLPFMIGNLWQLSRGESRESVCHLSKVYFSDYLKRCFNYEIIKKLPSEVQAASEDEEEEEEDEEGAAKAKKSAKRPPPKMNSDDVRAMKIQRFKEAKMLDEKISPFLNSHLKGERIDEEDLQTFIVSLLKRSALDAEDQLRSIAEELELIKYAAKMKIGAASGKSGASGSQSHPHSHSLNHSHPHNEKAAPKKPPQIFILTKTEVEKQVFGAGYPAVPVMTVEELYEHRRRTGQWGPPSASANLPPPTETDDDRDEQREALEEIDDDESLARERQMDEYKDEHRRGWGNRYNRS